ncbi:MAG: YDG domain-containing protein [Clostridia bacterium]
MTNSTLTGNVARNGGAVHLLFGNVYLLNSILVGNTNTLGLNDDAAFTYAYYCLIGAADGTITDIAAADIFANIGADGKAVLESDGTVAILANGAAATAGTKLQNKDGKLQYWDNNDWTTIIEKASESELTTAFTTDQLQTDQLGRNRLAYESLGFGYSVGAVSVVGENESLVVTTERDVVNAFDGMISLREAISYAKDGTTAADGTKTITFDPAVFTAENHTIKLGSTLGILPNAFGADNPLTIDGAVSETVSVVIDGGRENGAGGVQILRINSGNTVTLQNLTLQNGYVGGNGGAIFNYGTVTVANSTLTGNSADNSGGAIYNSGALTVINSTLTDNTADYSGGAIYNDGILTVANCTLTGNTANDEGGAVHNHDGNAYLLNSILVGNTAPDGGDLWTYGDSFTYTYAYYCLVGTAYNHQDGGTPVTGTDAFSGTPTGTTVENTFVGIFGTNTFNAQTGVILPLASGIGATAGTKLQNKDGKLQYFHNNDWVTAADKDNNEITTTLTTDRLQDDQLGKDRSAYATFGYSVGAVSVEPTEQPQAALTLTGIPNTITYGDSFTVGTNGGSGTGAVEYSSSDTDVATVDQTSGEVKIIGVGSFTITATKKADANYAEASVTSDALTANKKELKVNVTVVDKQYNGLTDAQISSAVPGGVVPGDTVTLTNGTPTFASFEVGTDIAISFTDFGISGADADNYTLTQPSGVTADIYNNFTGEDCYTTTPLNADGWTNGDFVITAKDGYELSRTNTANGTWQNTLTYSDETDSGSAAFYVRDKATGAISLAVTESYKIDKTAPEAEIKVETNSFKQFLNTITFGLFFKENVDVTITGTDALSGVAKVEYQKVAKQSDYDENGTWTEYAAFSVTQDEEFIVYARVTDNAGNFVIVNSNGIVVDKTAPAINGITDGEDYYGDTAFTFSDSYLDSVTVDGAPIDITSGSYTITADNAAHTITAKDKAGNETAVTVKVMLEGADYSEVDKAIEKANALNSDNYVDFSGVTAAINAVVRGKNITEQAEVDAMAKAINDAIDALTAKPSDNPQTGDSGNMLLWIALLFVSVSAAAGLTVYGRKRRVNR